MSTTVRGLVLRHAVTGIGDDDECFTLPALRGFSVARTPGDQAVVCVIGGAVDDVTGEQQTVMTFSLLRHAAGILALAIQNPPIIAAADLRIVPMAGVPGLATDDGPLRLPWEEFQRIQIQAEPIPPGFASTKTRSIKLLTENRLPEVGALPRPQAGVIKVNVMRIFLDADEADDLAIVLGA